jgi:hypothetical protein
MIRLLNLAQKLLERRETVNVSSFLQSTCNFYFYKTNTTVIYCHFRLNYTVVIFITLNLPWKGSKLLQYFNPGKGRVTRVKIAMVN